MKKFSIIYEELDYLKLSKPQIMYPTYMNYFGWESEVITYDLKRDLPDEIRRVKLTKLTQLLSFLPNMNLSKFIKRIPIYNYIYKNAKEIDVLMLYHLTKCSYWNTFFYKLGNPKGKVFIKGDFDFPEFQEEVAWLTRKPGTMREFFKKLRWKKEFKKRFKLVEMMDIFSVETIESYKGILEHGYAGKDVSDKLLHIPNGFDERLAKELEIKSKSFEEKENIIFTASRIGSKSKNTEFFLEVIKKIDLKSWKVVLAGPIEKEFQNKIDEFYSKNENLRSKVEFLGHIKDKKILYDYYNKSKIFMMTSKGEGFANVFLEALYFGNFIITTKVSSAEDVTSNGTIGDIIPQDDIEAYTNKLQRAMDDKVLKDKFNETLALSKEFLWENKLRVLLNKIDSITD